MQERRGADEVARRVLRILGEASSEYLEPGGGVCLASFEGVLGGPLAHGGDVVVALGRREGRLEGRSLDVSSLGVGVGNGSPRAHLEVRRRLLKGGGAGKGVGELDAVAENGDGLHLEDGSECLEPEVRLRQRVLQQGKGHQRGCGDRGRSRGIPIEVLDPLPVRFDQFGPDRHGIGERDQPVQLLVGEVRASREHRGGVAARGAPELR